MVVRTEILVCVLGVDKSLVLGQVTTVVLSITARDSALIKHAIVLSWVWQLVWRRAQRAAGLVDRIFRSRGLLDGKIL